MHLSRWSIALTLCLVLPVVARADDWPQWLGPQRDSVWRETGIMKELPKDGPPVKWRAPVAYGYAGPAVADGKVYVFDYETMGNPHTDAMKAKLQGKERLWCLNADTGKEIWKYSYECEYNLGYPNGPRCTPTVVGDKVFILGAMGDLTCLNTKDGSKVWTKNLLKEYKASIALWGYACHPLIVGDKLYCLAGGEDSAAICLNKDTGKEIWHSLTTKNIGYAPPALIKAGGVDQLLIWHSESLNSLDPATGKLYWSEALEPMFGMAIMTPRKLDDLVFVGAIGNQGMLVKLAADKPTAEVVWRSKPTSGVYPCNSTPFLEDGYIYGVDTDGNLRCVNMKDGKREWETAKPIGQPEATKTGTAFLVKNGDRFYIFNEKGELIIAKLSPKGYDEVSRAKILEPTSKAFGRDVVWSQPAFANRCMVARNDKECVCVSLAGK
jgi:outer membrane protein assembly factor BamB